MENVSSILARLTIAKEIEQHQAERIKTNNADIHNGRLSHE